MGGLRQKRGQRKPHHSKRVQSEGRRSSPVRYEGVGRNRADGKDGHQDTPPAHNRWRQLGFMCANNIKTLSSFSSVILLNDTKAGKHMNAIRILYWSALPILAFAVFWYVVESNGIYEFHGLSMILTTAGGAVCLLISLKCYVSYADYYKSKNTLNRHLQLSSRYIDVCQVSTKEIEQLLPVFEKPLGLHWECALVGSAADSFGFFPSQSANMNLFNNKPVYINQDLDINIFLKRLSLREDNLTPVGGSTFETTPGFTWISLSKAQVKGIEDHVLRNSFQRRKDKNTGLSRLYLSGEALTDTLKRHFPDMDPKVVEFVDNKPAYTFRSTVKNAQGTFAFEIDYGFALKYAFWPDVASGFQSRSKPGVPNELSDSIMREGCYLVHKPCGRNEPHDHGLDWRFTFANAESYLFRHHGSKAGYRLSYAILKAIIKVFIREKKKDFPVLRSYHLKTIFLWFAERRDFSEDLKPADVFLHILEDYIKALNEKDIPHYFVSHRNMLAPYNNEQILEAVELLEDIHRRPVWHVHFHFDNIWLPKRKLTKVLTFFALLSILCTFISLFFKRRSKRLLAEIQHDTGIKDFVSYRDLERQIVESYIKSAVRDLVKEFNTTDQSG